MRLLIVEPLGGLGNRMRVVDSACVLAQEIDARLRVVWRLDRALAAPFGALFEPPPEIAEFVEIELHDRKTVGHRIRHYIESCKPDLVLETAMVPQLDEGGLDPQDLPDHGTLYIRTFNQFRIGAAPFRMFVPVAGLRAHIEGITSRYDETIGIHIRRTDNERATAISSTKYFIERMTRALERAEARSFFLATDDPREQRAIEATFPRRILSHPKRSLDRRDAVAAEDAVVDLFCLARTKRLLGSHKSSFSRTAAVMGGIRIHTVGLKRRSLARKFRAKLRSLFRR